MTVASYFFILSSDILSLFLNWVLSDVDNNVDDVKYRRETRTLSVSPRFKAGYGSDELKMHDED